MCSETRLFNYIHATDHEEKREEKDENEENGEEENGVPPFTISAEASPSVIVPPFLCCFPEPVPDLQIIVERWSEEFKPDVMFAVYGNYFFLHREPMAACSRFLKRCLKANNYVMVSPPFNITSKTFVDVAKFCYTGTVTLSLSNLVDLTAAAEFLEMDGGDAEFLEMDGGNEKWSLARRTEEYFREEIVGDEAKVEQVFWSCVMKLPKAGEAVERLTACCVQVFGMARGYYDEGWTTNLMRLPVDSLALIMKWMLRVSTADHDALYIIAKNYLEANRETLTEQAKLSICRQIDCTKLSHHARQHLARNSLIPQSFQLETSLGLANSTTTTNTQSDSLHHDDGAADHQATSLVIRIESLENQVDALRRRLHLYEGEQVKMEPAGAIRKRRGLERRLFFHSVG